jgi:hypothetical protein
MLVLNFKYILLSYYFFPHRVGVGPDLDLTQPLWPRARARGQQKKGWTWPSPAPGQCKKEA